MNSCKIKDTRDFYFVGLAQAIIKMKEWNSNVTKFLVLAAPVAMCIEHTSFAPQIGSSCHRNIF